MVYFKIKTFVKKENYLVTIILIYSFINIYKYLQKKNKFT